eukprot:3163331-Karenia_brevis.AAC.1
MVKSRRKMKCHVHGDRWAQVWNIIKNLLDESVRVAWTKAHVTAKMQSSMQMEFHVLIGNECADALAKR